jgi:hypothetical protein
VELGEGALEDLGMNTAFPNQYLGRNAGSRFGKGVLNQATLHWHTGSVGHRTVPAYLSRQVYESHVD